MNAPSIQQGYAPQNPKTPKILIISLCHKFLKFKYNYAKNIKNMLS